MKDISGTGMLERVQEFVLERSAAGIPEAVLRRAGFLLLDTLGICAAASPMEAGRIGRQTAAMLYGAGAPEMAARMLFDGRQVSLAGAVFAAATQLDNLDGHDGYNPTKGHIGVVTVPTLAALAEARPELTGPEALAALVVGYEVAGRAGIALHATVSDYHTSGAWNALGVAAMAARLRGQSRAQLREALGIAEYHGPRSQMMREIATPTMLHDGSGWGALAGMSAALMAEQGFTGAPAITIEAPEAAAFWQDLGQFWQVEQQYIKPYPTCRWAHAAVDAVRELCKANAASAGDVAEVRIRSFDYALALWPGMPETTSKAQYALPFPVAVMIVHGRIGLEHVSGAGLSDPEVARLVGRTRLIPEPRHEARYPEGRWADVELELTDGRVLASGDTHARGGPERPFTEADIIDKYMEFATPALGAARASGLRDAVLGLAGGAPFAEVARHLYAPL
ncbi:MmgE/PrpD family protein [Seohaeicola zhoushanensis]|uniref:2-methylcitrate dehydratase n=1 Tax=Seohaeicola zhoushanensis TaxID=1569283 RepID=A0A8J3M5S0_9RHOB|nr:MmgE/PrpD family protein [Seohaeicola zhoushanensis]GHF43887.1 2-methylcitrate dehydratase [Seohaeicola zhoushanensis]